jgi:hypothetical protein
MATPIFYVYQYLDEEGTPFYIGKGSKDRINESHLPWVQIPPADRRQFIQTGMEEKEAFDLEIKLIKKYGRKIDGGILENIKLTRWVAQAGWKHSDEAKKRISKKNTGKIRTEQHKQNYRKPKTIEHANQINDVVQNLWNNPEYKEQRLAKLKEKPFAHKGKPWSPARREAYMKKQTNKGSAV